MTRAVIFVNFPTHPLPVALERVRVIIPAYSLHHIVFTFTTMFSFYGLSCYLLVYNYWGHVCNQGGGGRLLGGTNLSKIIKVNVGVT